MDWSDMLEKGMPGLDRKLLLEKGGRGMLQR